MKRKGKEGETCEVVMARRRQRGGSANEKAEELKRVEDLAFQATKGRISAGRQGRP